MTRPPAHHVRRGATLVEALLGTLLGAIVLAAALDVVVRTTRARREHAARAAARAQLEQAATALTADLRPITTTASGDDPSDLRAVTDTSIEIAATVGGGVACAVATAPGAGSTIDLASPPEAATAPALTWWSTPPRPGDFVYAYDDAGTPTSTDDRWTVRSVRAVSEGTTYCRSGPFAAAAAAGARADAPRLRLTLDGLPLSAAAGAGTPVRVARRRRYSLYRAADGWQLGVRDWDGVDWEVVQPVAGPFDSPGSRGLQLEAVDAAGGPVQGTPPGPGAVEFRVVLHTSCTAYERRSRCADSTVAVVRPRGGV